jgi:type IV pilus assembly protein PilC
LKRISVEIAQDIRAGSSLHAALGKHPSVFSRLYCSMVQAGEASGALPQVLQRLIYVISHEYKVKSDVRAAVQYPILVLVALVVAFVVLLTMVIPRFAKIYAGVNLELPWPTLVCIALSNFMRNQWMLIVGALVILVVGYWIAMRRPEARLWRDRMFMRIPLIGNLLVKSALSRFASIFSILQSAGVGILDALNILAETIGNAAMTKELQRVQYLLEEGHGIARPLRSARYFTPMFVNMVAIGRDAQGGFVPLRFRGRIRHAETHHGPGAHAHRPALRHGRVLRAGGVPAHVGFGQDRHAIAMNTPMCQSNTATLPPEWKEVL